ncbi:MAG: hypothetical protein AAGG48_07455 [Planctomycetota bacterium]
MNSKSSGSPGLQLPVESSDTKKAERMSLSASIVWIIAAWLVAFLVSEVSVLG